MTRSEFEEMDMWDAEDCIAFLERHGAEAPEYDLEAKGLELLRRDCRAEAAKLTRAA